MIDNITMSATIKNEDIWNSILVPELHKKFIKEISSTKHFEELVSGKSGKIVLDHGATRTTEPELHAFLTRLAGAFGLEPCDQYTFPDKKLKSVDLQFKNKKGFKWFSTLIDYEKLSKEACAAILEDNERTNNRLSSKGMEMLEKLEKDKALPQSTAEEFTHEILYKFLKRQGPPVLKKTFDLLEKESSEATNALFLGPDFNHIAYLINKLSIEEWYGLDVIEALTAKMEKSGFKMLPKIQGEVGGVLRQTSTKADKIMFPVENADGSIIEVEYPAKFLELIQRGAERDENKKIVFTENEVKVFQGFLRDNTDKLFEATRPEKH